MHIAQLLLLAAAAAAIAVALKIDVVTVLLSGELWECKIHFTVSNH